MIALWIALLFGPASVSDAQDSFVATITAEVSATCSVDPDDTEFKFGPTWAGRTLREPIKNNSNAACISEILSFDPPETENQVEVIVPDLLLPGAYADVVITTGRRYAGRISGTLTIQWHTARLFVVDPDHVPSKWRVELTIPEGSLVRAWGNDHYVTEGSSITYRWRPAWDDPPEFDKWLITGIEGLTESTENPITLTADLSDVTLTPVVIEPLP